MLFIHKNTFSIKLNRKEFFRSQVAAFLGTAVDYFIFGILTYLFGIWYVYANVVSATFGAITNFLLGKYWAFQAKEGKMGAQAIRYALVSFGSLVLNTLGIYLITEFFNLDPTISKLLIGLLVAVTYNYLMQKYFVFRVSD